MNFMMTKDLDIIRQLHKHIFMDTFPEDKYFRRIEKGQKLYSFIFLDDNGSAAGYGIAVEDRPNLHMWIGGVLPNFRKMGIMGKFFGFMEEFARENNYQWLTLHTDNTKINLLRMAIRHGFDIYDTRPSNYGNGSGLRLRRRITSPVNLRLALTRKCNYRCFFCHGEGIPEKAPGALSIPDIESILAQAGKLNLKTLTFTGGEPLLEKQTLLHGIKFCEGLGVEPTIKLVTNGAHLDAAFARKLSDFSRVHVNLSLHGADKLTCAKITGSAEAFSRTLKAIDNLNSYKIPFRLNTVLLKGLNDNPAQIATLLQLAYEHEIPNVTFLELHARPGTPGAQSHLDFSSIKLAIKAAVTCFKCLEEIEHSPLKSIYYLHIDGKIIALNLFRLSCRAGCQECARHRDETIGPDGQMYSCFMSDQSCGDARRDLYGALQQSATNMQFRISENFRPLLSNQS